MEDGVGNPKFIPARSEIHRGLDLLGRAAYASTMAKMTKFENPRHYLTFEE